MPQLADFFGDDKPEFLVRGLTLDEINRAREAPEQAKMMTAMVDAMAAGNGKAAGEAAAGVMGASLEGVAPKTAIEMAMLRMGTVEPELDMLDVVLLAEGWPIETGQMLLAINELTGMGKRQAGLPPSG